MSAMRNALIAAAILLPLSYTVADAQGGMGGFGRQSMGARSGGGGGGAAAGGGTTFGRAGGGGATFGRAAGGGGGATFGRVGGGGGGAATFGRGGSGGVVGGGAGPWRGGYRGYRGRYRSNVFIGFGGFYDPFFDPFWPYPYYYPYGYGFGYSYAYRPPVAYAPPPEDYLLPPNAPAPEQVWYYCEDPSGYYPYVRSCNREWQAVPARPEGAPPANLSSNDPSGAGEGATN